jgi:tRNA 2-selenouridine synthase
MRSAGVAWLLDLYGFKVYTLTGGYKKFRRLVLDTFSLNFKFSILGGFTGSGKTELLKELKENGERVINLEGLANHKGSAFGNIGLPAQPSQEMFENKLALQLRALSNESNTDYSITPFRATEHSEGWERSSGGIWLEDESQRIGLVNIPNNIWRQMRQSELYFLDIPFEERLKYIIKEYGNLDQEKMTEAIKRIREKLGGLNAKNAIEQLQWGDIEGCFRILLAYYDKYYLKALHNRESLDALLYRIDCKSVTPENTRQLVREPKYLHQASMPSIMESPWASKSLRLALIIIFLPFLIHAQSLTGLYTGLMSTIVIRFAGTNILRSFSPSTAEKYQDIPGVNSLSTILFIISLNA